MAFRFKDQIPTLNPTFVDPQGVQKEMQNYPMSNAVYQGITDEAAMAARTKDIQGQISQLEAELAQVEGQIAEIDKTMPRNVNEKEWEIAAKRAEIGDMSAYDSMMQRANNQNGQASGIENELYNAHKLLYGLNAKDDYEQGAYANQIETALRKAEEWSARNPGAAMPPIYADLKSKYEAWKGGNAPRPVTGGQGPAVTSWVESIRNENDATNKIDAMVKDGTWSKADLDAGYAWVKANPNSPYTKTIKDKLDSVKSKTVEAKAAAASAAKKMDAVIKAIINKSPAEQDAWWNSLTDKERAAYLKKITWKTGNSGTSYLDWRK